MDGDYTLAEVAEIMRRPVDSVRIMARGKRLPGAYQLVAGGRWRVRSRDFDDWHAGLGPVIDDPLKIEPRSKRSEARRKQSA